MEEEGRLPLVRGRAPWRRETDMDLRRLMDEAIDIAAAAFPHPNPRVGALIVAPDGEIVARGRHDGPGLPHAEIAALQEAGDRAVGATMVVTLEPCVHTGRTPPCTEQIVAARIAHVVVGSADPDRRVDGGGIRRLEEAGIRVTVLDDPAAAVALDPGYFHHRRTGRPRVTLKLAATLDGQVAAADGTSQWITSPEARLDAHRLRAAADAVMVGAGTVRSDRPSLAARLPEGEPRRQPRPVVVAGAGPLPSDAPLWSRDPIVLASSPREVPGELLLAPGERGVDLDGGLTALGEAGIIDLLVEGGPTLAGSLLRGGLVDRGVYYLGGLLAGGAGLGSFAGTFATLSDARPLRILDVTRLGPDLRVDFELEER